MDIATEDIANVIMEELEAVLDEKRKKKRKKRKKAGTESSKESSLREKGEKRKKYPACRPTPGACKERGKGKSWGKKAKRRSKKK